MLFDIDPKQARTVRRILSETILHTPWEILPVEPGSDREQLFINDHGEASLLVLTMPRGAIRKAYVGGVQ